MARTSLLALAVLVLAGAAPATAFHLPDCVPTRADPSTYYLVDVPGRDRFYVEERDVPPPFDATTPPPPLSGFLFGGGTWIYEEANGLDAPEGSLQRGWIGLLSGCFPPSPFPCLIGGGDPMNDETCSHGPDRIWPPFNF